MARPLRLQFPGALYHITSRGNERKNIFRDNKDKEKFLKILSLSIERYHLVLHAYVLMDNHYHLLVETREVNLSLALRHLNGVYTTYFNRAHKRIGHLFQGRYKAILVEKESYLLELSRYIHLNPYRAKMDVRLEKFPWSSFRAYIGKEKAPSWLSCEEVLAYFGVNTKNCFEEYKKFIEDGIQKGIKRPWDKIIGQVVLGGENFLEKIQKKVEEGTDREVPSRRQLERRPTWDLILRKVESRLPDLLELKTGNRSNPQRGIIIYLGRERGGLSLREISQKLGLEESTISQTAGRVCQLRNENSRWRKVLHEIEQSLIPNS